MKLYRTCTVVCMFLSLSVILKYSLCVQTWYGMEAGNAGDGPA